ALRQLADRMERLHGRKSLVWLSVGFPRTIGPGVVSGAKPAEIQYLREVEEALAPFTRADIAVHAVNTHGLAATGRSFGDILMEFAERTGGTFFSDRNDLEEGVRVALDDMFGGYTLGFVVPEGAKPGLHAIEVRVKRPRVLVRFRKSYQLAK